MDKDEREFLSRINKLNMKWWLALIFFFVFGFFNFMLEKLTGDQSFILILLQFVFLMTFAQSLKKPK